VSLTSKYSGIALVIHSAASTRQIFGQLAIALLLASSAAAFGQDKATAVGIGKQSITPLVCLVRDMATGTNLVKVRTLGTGFIIRPKGTFITANHVIVDFNSSPWTETCKAVIYFPIGGWYSSTDVRWFLFDPKACQVNIALDVAVCRTTDDISQVKEITYRIPTISGDRPTEGTNVFFSGFPL
jgi:hypothetical protein